MNKSGFTHNPDWTGLAGTDGSWRAGSDAGAMAGFRTALKLGPRWLLLAILVYAPWAYGSTRPESIVTLNMLLAVCLGSWLISCIALRQRPRCSPFLCVPALFLIAQGWWMAVNAKYDFNPVTWEFAQRSAMATWAPGGLDRTVCLRIALRTTLLLGALIFVSHLASDRVWASRIFSVIALTGLSIALFGMVQRLAGAPSIFWEARDTGKTFFATYRYHSNAGTFLNLVWPIVGSFLILSFRRSRTNLPRVAWAAGLGVCLAGMAVCGARAAAVLAVLMVVVGLIWLRVQIRKGYLPSFDPATVSVAAVLLLLLVGSAAAMAGLDISLRRWNKFEEILSPQNPRLLVDQVCLTIIPDAGWWGFGPGVFQAVFPHYTGHLGNAISGVWQHAHQDYLQTLIEWGYLGSAAWSVCIFGGLWSAWRRRPQGFTELTMRWMATTSVVLVLLHSLVDFPLQIASLQLYFVVLLGVLWGVSRNPAASLPSHQPGRLETSRSATDEPPLRTPAGGRRSIGQK